ncbi:MAG: hypothetical protein HY928_14480 [Elusimicrobia bacterium]|nr:hypothetical protein [Elusimicrobiota bacterium]
MTGGVDGADWVVGRGVGPYWRAVAGIRASAAHAELRAARDWAARSGPESLKGWEAERSIDAVLDLPPAQRDALLLFPAMDCWLSLTPGFLAGARTPEEAELHFSFFNSFAAAAAALSGASRAFPVRLSKDARFHATGTREWFEFPLSAAGARAECRARAGRLEVRLGGVKGKPRLLPALSAGTWVEQRDPLALQPVVMHGLGKTTAREEARFAAVLTGAMDRIRAVDRPLFEEMRSFLRLIVPLENPKNYGSVSSSYRNLRGALCLSHSEDSLLQEETLIHEFCHQKVNLLLAADPLLRPGQGGQVVYSPLRPDARRLAGVMLGAHAFINVNRYLLRVLRREPFPARVRTQVQQNIARRIFHVEDMLRTVSMYADLTPAGERFQTRMWREHALVIHDGLDIPAAVIEEGRTRWRQHRGQKALGETGLYAEASK